MNLSKELLRNYNNNGYSFSYFDNGFYFFQKQIGKGFNLLKFKEIDFLNGNFEFCTDNDISRM